MPVTAHIGQESPVLYLRRIRHRLCTLEASSWQVCDSPSKRGEIRVSCALFNDAVWLGNVLASISLCASAEMRLGKTLSPFMQYLEVRSRR